MWENSGAGRKSNCFKNDAQMQVVAIDDGYGKLGEYWSIKIDDGKYFLNLKCD